MMTLSEPQEPLEPQDAETAMDDGLGVGGDDDGDRSSEDLPPIDLEEIDLLMESSVTDTIFANYVQHIANDGLLPYQYMIHNAGPKAGESLYTHILNGIMILQQLRPLLGLSDLETQILFTAYTIHDINKMIPDGETTSYANLATRSHVEPLIQQLHLDIFFPEYADYLEDILHLMREHPAHLTVGLMDGLDLRNAPRYGLDRERVVQLSLLMKAADEIDLSQTLEEQSKKDFFLKHLNQFSKVQYTFITHRVSEQRGSFTNIIHNAVMKELSMRGLTPLLIYPEGVAYLCPVGTPITIDERTISSIAMQVAGTLNTMSSERFKTFIEAKSAGISVDKKCLDLGIPFQQIFDVAYAIIQKRPYVAEKREQMNTDAVRRTRKALQKQPPASQELADTIEGWLQTGPLPHASERMRTGELLRTYYIFLLEHFKESIPNPWEYLYRLIDEPQEHDALYEYFNERMDRAYVVAAQNQLSDREIQERIWQDGINQLGQIIREDPRVPLITAYLRQVLIFSHHAAKPGYFANALPNYVTQQHRQCVQCNMPFPTEPWMSGHVRSDIKVQLFSNRLKGGPGEPKRNVCGICQIQFLMEKLNYREVRGEESIYLHLFPYSFQPEPFVNAMRRKISTISKGDHLSGALFLNDAEKTMLSIARQEEKRKTFTTRTKANKPQPYGIYVPRYAETLGGVMTFPLNAVGENDTERFLFALQYALLLQHHFGCKVLMSKAVTPPLEKEAFGDVFFDMTPLSGRGLVRHNDYAAYPTKRANRNGNGATAMTTGHLKQLWKELEYLYVIQRGVLVANSKLKPMTKLVMAMSDQALSVFHAAERLAEEKTGSADAGWVMKTIADDVRNLAISRGGYEMQALDAHLEQLARIAWKGGLRGKSLKKNSLMTPLDEVLNKLSILGQELNSNIIQAATAQDLYEHLVRIHGVESKRLNDRCVEFVTVFFEKVFEGVYHGKLARLMNHEKVLRSAFHFYIRQQIPRKAVLSDDASGSTDTGDDEDTVPYVEENTDTGDDEDTVSYVEESREERTGNDQEDLFSEKTNG